MGLDCLASPTEFIRDRRGLPPAPAFETEDLEVSEAAPPPLDEEERTTSGSGFTRLGFLGTGPFRLTTLGLNRELRAFFLATAEAAAAAAAASPLLVERARAPALMREDDVFFLRWLSPGSGLTPPAPAVPAPPDVSLLPRRLPPREPDKRARETEAPMADFCADFDFCGMVFRSGEERPRRVSA